MLEEWIFLFSLWCFHLVTMKRGRGTHLVLSGRGSSSNASKQHVVFDHVSLHDILMFCQHTWIKEGARWRNVCIPKQLEGARRQMPRFYVYVFAQWLQRYGGPGRTKGQGQISWLHRGNSWEKRTRKSLHFIKGPAGASRSPPTPPSLTPPSCLSSDRLVRIFSWKYQLTR